MNKNKTAVILIGGHSRRMGRDKSLLRYHNKTQREHLAELFWRLGFRVLFSGRQEQRIDEQLFVVDEYPGTGPASAIVSALRYVYKRSDSLQSGDWLFVSSCDQPLLDSDIIDDLWQQSQLHVDSQVLMHCYASEQKSRQIEPLPSVWHSEAIGYCIDALSQHKYAIRDMLDCHQIQAHNCPDYAKLINVNSPAQQEVLFEGCNKSR